MSILSEGNNFGKKISEDFSMGVEGPLGLNQGIPHGGPGKGVLPKPLYDPKAKAVPPSEKKDEDTEKNKSEIEKSLNKKPVTEAKLSKNLQLYIKKTDGSTTRLQFVSREEAMRKSTLIRIADLYTSDWTELWTVGYELDDDGYATREIKDTTITNPKLVSEKKLQEGKGDLGALELLGALHYQICNGGIEQAANNGYLDILNEYGYNKFIMDLRNLVDISTDAGAACLDAAVEIIDACEEIQMCKLCQDCDGSGEYESEDEYGDSISDTCDLCNGEGTLSVDRFSDVDFGDGTGNEWTDDWDSKYYEKINSDLIDDATNQSHTHSDLLDAIRSNQQKNESVNDPFEDYLQRVGWFLHKAFYDNDEIDDYIALHERELLDKFEKGDSPEEAIADILDEV